MWTCCIAHKLGILAAFIIIKLPAYNVRDSTREELLLNCKCSVRMNVVNNKYTKQFLTISKKGIANKVFRSKLKLVFSKNGKNM